MDQKHDEASFQHQLLTISEDRLKYRTSRKGHLSKKDLAKLNDLKRGHQKINFRDGTSVGLHLASHLWSVIKADLGNPLSFFQFTLPNIVNRQNLAIYILERPLERILVTCDHRPLGFPFYKQKED